MPCARCHAPLQQEMRYCGQCGRPAVEVPELRERRRVTILFIDTVGFSTLTQTEDPEYARSLANDVLTLATRIIQAHGGFVVSMQGDGVMGLFGAPRAHPDDPERALRAAQATLAAMEALGQRRGILLQGRAGVNSGVVIAGAVGTRDAQPYTVMGRAVNLAARLEQAAGPGEVWVGPDTAALVAQPSLFASTGPIELAGFPDVPTAFRLTQCPEADSFEGRSAEFLVHREEAHAAVQTALDAVRSVARPQQCWVTGEAGMGKTRFLRELHANLQQHGNADATCGVAWLSGEADGGVQWQTLADVLTSTTARTAGEEVPEPGNLDACLTRLLPNEPRWQAAIRASLMPAEPQEAWRRLDRRAANRSALAWRDLLVAWMREDARTLVLLVDDEPGESELDTFLDALLGARAPILIVRTALRRPTHNGAVSPSDQGAVGRAGDRVGQALEPHVEQEVCLGPLGQEASLALLEKALGHRLLPELASWLRCTNGNPGYLMALAHALKLPDEELRSQRLQMLIHARLDHLASHTRILLTHAAVSGMRTWHGLLESLCPGCDRERIESLLEEGFLIPLDASEIAAEKSYRFATEELREAALGLVPTNERAPIHATYASWLARNAPLMRETPMPIRTEVSR